MKFDLCHVLLSSTLCYKIDSSRDQTANYTHDGVFIPVRNSTANLNDESLMILDWIIQLIQNGVFLF